MLILVIAVALIIINLYICCVSVGAQTTQAEMLQGLQTLEAPQEFYQNLANTEYLYPNAELNPWTQTAWSDDYCNKTGMDFLVLIDPTACSPAVVRSDLLEEQDVPVLCRMTGVKINPLIQVPYIKSITPTVENKSNEIGFVNFLPARIALSYAAHSEKMQGGLEGLPTMNNLGYLWIQLKQQPVEAKMPESVKANMSVKIRYDVAKTYGIAENQIVLPLLSNDEWQTRYKEFGFWRGKGYLKLQEITGLNTVKVSVYTNPSSAPIKIVELREGVTPSTKDEIMLPGFYCGAGLRLKLEQITTPTNRIRALVNGNELLLGENDDILDSGCKVGKIIPSLGYGGSVAIQCTGDRRTLTIQDYAAKIEVKDVGGTEARTMDVSVGSDIAVRSGEQTPAKHLYVGFMGKQYSAEGFRDFMILFSRGKELTTINSQDIPKIVDKIHDYMKSARGESLDVAVMPETTLAQKLKELLQSTSYGKELNFWVRNTQTEQPIGIDSISIPFRIISMTGPQQTYYEKSTEDVYKDAIAKWRDITFAYPTKASPEGAYYGVIALRNAAKLAGYMHKSLDEAELLKELIDKYSTSEEADVIAEVESAREDLRRVVAGGGDRRATFSRPNGNYDIELLAIEKPGLGTKEAQVEINDTKETLIVDDEVDGWGVQNITDTAVVFENLSNTSNIRTIATGDRQYLGNTKVQVLNTVLKREAKITVLPFEKERETIANFTVQIGIEKRAIQLSPEKTNEMIAKLNKTIASLEKVRDSLGKIVTVWKKACFAGAGALWVKNFVTGLSGEAYARKIVMEPWTSLCSDPVYRKNIGAKSISDCYRIKEQSINQDISLVKSSLDKTNKFVSDVKKKPGVTTTGGLFGLSKSVDDNKFMQEAQDNFPTELKDITIYEEKELRRINLADGKIEFDGQNWTNIDELLAAKPSVDRSLIAKVWGNSADSTNIAGSFTKLYGDGRLFREDVKDVVLDLELYKECKDMTSSQVASSALCQDTLKGAYGKLNNYQQLIDEDRTSKALYDIIGLNAVVVPSKYQTIKSPVYRVDDFSGKLPQEIKTKYTGSRFTYLFVGGIYYIAIVEPAGNNNFPIKALYSIEKTGTDIKVIESWTSETAEKVDAKLAKMKISAYVEEIDPTKCNSNEMKAPYRSEIKFWESGAYQGFVAWMPVDVRAGWYVATTGYSGLEGAMVAWKENADINTFWICNVGPDGIANFDHTKGPSGDDCCTQVALVTGNVPEIAGCLTSACSNDLVTKAKKCSAEAIKAFAAGNRKIKTSCGEFTLAKPPAARPAAQCEDYMSPTDCRIMYNLCDPVMCPASRCDFGGRMPVDNVIQSGIIGSIMLCWPNFEDGRGVLVPVCLTGVHAGLDSFVGILKSGRDCLQEQLKSGKTVGICDQITSIYMCEFFWKQIDPFLKAGLPSLAESLTTRGGGEYALFSESWKQSVDAARYFTDYYGVQSFNAFKARSTAQIGTEICKKYASVAYPTQAKFWDELSKPESPAQATAWFDEIPMGGASPDSHYKVFFYIFAGRDQGAYYSVYFRRPAKPGYYEQFIPEEYLIKDGFGYLPAGQYISMSPDFTAPSGYTEICIRINDKETCGFGQASTNFAVNELQNYYLETELDKGVTTAKDCVSGSPTIIPTATLNIQSYVESSVEPQIYRKGIIRVCSSRNPGESIQQTERFKAIGYCDSQNVVCWLDMNSVNESVSDLGIRSDIINESEFKDIKYWTEKFNLSAPEASRDQLDNIEPTIREAETAILSFIDNAITPAVATLYEKEKSKELSETELRTEYNIIKDKVKAKDDELIKPLLVELNKIRDKCARTDEKARADYDIAKLYDLRARLYAQPEVYKVKKQIEEAQQITCADLGGIWKDSCTKYEQDRRGEVGEKEKSLAENVNKKCCVLFRKEKLEVLPVDPEFFRIGACYSSASDHLMIMVANKDEPLKAIAGGTIMKIEKIGQSFLQITINHNDDFYSRYMGQITIAPNLKEGDFVEEGDTVGIAKHEYSFNFWIYEDDPIKNKNIKGKNPFCYFSKEIQTQMKSKCPANIEECEKGAVAIPLVALKDAVIVIDPGHGGSDPGTHGDSINEDEVNLNVSLKLRDLLKGKVKEVILTRESDISAPGRATTANNNNANLFISIHSNGAKDTTSKGTEVWINCIDCTSKTYRNDIEGKDYRMCTSECKDTDDKYKLSKSFADIVLGKITSEVGTNRIEVKAWDDPDSTYIRDANMPAVLVELGFMTNKDDLDKLKNNQDEFAQAIYDAVVEYFGEAVIAPPSKCADLGPKECPSQKNCWWDSKTGNGKCLKCPDKCEGNNVWFGGNWLGIDDLIFKTQPDCEKNNCYLDCLWIENSCFSVSDSNVEKKLLKINEMSTEELTTLRNLIEKNKGDTLNLLSAPGWLAKIDAKLALSMPQQVLLASQVNNGELNTSGKLINSDDNVLMCAVIKMGDKYYSKAPFSFRASDGKTYNAEKYDGEAQFKWYNIVAYQSPQYDGAKATYELPFFGGGAKDMLQYDQQSLSVSSSSWCIDQKQANSDEGTYWYRVEVSFDGANYYSSLGKAASEEDKAAYETKYSQFGINFDKYENKWNTLLEPRAVENFGVSREVLRISRKSNYDTTTCAALGYSSNDLRCQFIATVEAFKNVPFAFGCNSYSCETQSIPGATTCSADLKQITENYIAADCINLMISALSETTNKDYPFSDFDAFISADTEIIRGIKDTPITLSNILNGQPIFKKDGEVKVGDILFVWKPNQGYSHTFIIYNDAGTKPNILDEDDVVVYSSNICPDPSAPKDTKKIRNYDGKLCYAPIGRYINDVNLKYILVRVTDLG